MPSDDLQNSTPPVMPPPGPTKGFHTVDSLANLVKSKYPDYASWDNNKLVDGLIQKHPEYQTWLSDDTLQQRASRGAPTFGSTVKDIAGNINESMSQGLGRNAGEMWENTKKGTRNLLSMVGPNATRDPITAATEWVGNKIDEQYGPHGAVAQYSPDTDLGKRALAAIPIVGPTAAGIVGDVEKGHLADAALNTGRGILQGASGARMTEGFRNLVHDAPPISDTVGRAYDTVRPGPDIAPGVSNEARANLANKSARLGVEDVFRAAGPSGGNPAFRERLSIAAPDIAEIQRKTPLQTSGGFVNPDFRVREFVTNADNHLNNLWNEQRMPQIQRNAAAVRSLDPIKQSIIDSISDLDRENYPGAVQEINRKIMTMPDTETLGQLSERLREVNAQRNAYRSMTPQERAAANITSPKMDAVNAEYQGLQDVISDELANRGETGVREFDKRYGALSEVRDALRDQMNPTEATRLLDQVRAWVSPGGAMGIHERVPVTASRGRTLETGLNRLARSPLAPPVAPEPNPPRVAGLLPLPPIPPPPATMPARDFIYGNPVEDAEFTDIPPSQRGASPPVMPGIRTTPFGILPAPATTPSGAATRRLLLARPRPPAR